MKGDVVSSSSQPAAAVAAPKKRRFLDMNDTATFASALLSPAKIVLLLIIIFPLLSEIYISLTAWDPTKGGNWWEAYRS
jgi:ABC-type sugar transport system permease subunit